MASDPFPWVLATYLTVDGARGYVPSGRPPALRGTWDVTCCTVTGATSVHVEQVLLP